MPAVEFTVFDAEGLAEPTTYVDDLRRHGFDDDACRTIIRDNGLALARRRVPAAAG